MVAVDTAEDADKRSTVVRFVVDNLDLDGADILDSDADSPAVDILGEPALDIVVFGWDVQPALVDYTVDDFAE